MTNTENLEALETQIQNWIEKQNRIAKEIQYELNAIEREERVKEKEGKLTKLIMDIIKTLSTPEDIDWVHIEDMVIEAERLDNEIKEEK